MVLRKTKLICISILGLHYLISIIGLPALNKADLYPFYDWNLFSWTPPLQEQIYIRVLAVNGKTIPSTQWVNTNRETYPGHLPNLVPHQINRFGFELIKQQGLSTNGLRYKKEMEKNIFSGFESAVYQVEVVQVNWRELVKTGKVASIRPVGNFSYFRLNHND